MKIALLLAAALAVTGQTRKTATPSCYEDGAAMATRTLRQNLEEQKALGHDIDIDVMIRILRNIEKATAK